MTRVLLFCYLMLAAATCDAQVRWEFQSGADPGVFIFGTITTAGSSSDGFTHGQSLQVLSLDTVFLRTFRLDGSGSFSDTEFDWGDGGTPPFTNVNGFVDVFGTDGNGTTSFLSATDALGQSGVVLNEGHGAESYVLAQRRREFGATFPSTTFTVAVPEPCTTSPLSIGLALGVLRRRRPAG
jgi:hypothetical protein